MNGLHLLKRSSSLYYHSCKSTEEGAELGALIATRKGWMLFCTYPSQHQAPDQQQQTMPSSPSSSAPSSTMSPSAPYILESPNSTEVPGTPCEPKLRPMVGKKDKKLHYDVPANCTYVLLRKSMMFTVTSPSLRAAASTGGTRARTLCAPVSQSPPGTRCVMAPVSSPASTRETPPAPAAIR